MTYVHFDGARSLAARETIPLHEQLPEDFTRHWCGPVVVATQRIVYWLS